MFDAIDLERLENAVSCYIGEFMGAVSEEEIEDQQRLLEKIRRQRWITEKTPMRYMRRGREQTGVILEFLDTGPDELVRLRKVDELAGMTHRVPVSALIGPV